MNIVTRDILVNLKYHTQCWAESHYRPIFILAWIKSAGKSIYTGNENEIEPLTSENANVNHTGKILGGGGNCVQSQQLPC